MRKIFFIARREFLATVMTRGFLIGLLLLPALLAIGFTFGPRLMQQQAKPVEGTVAVADPTGMITDRLRDVLQPSAVAARRAREADANLPAAVRDAGLAETTLQQIHDRAAAESPRFQFVDLGDPSSARQWLLAGRPEEHRLAALVIAPDAVRGTTSSGSYAVFVAPRLDPRVEGSLYDGMREVLIAARAAGVGIPRDGLDAIMTVARPRSIAVTATGDRASDAGFAQALPLVFVFLMFFGVMVGGQGLLTSTLEEKSSRVVEVLLSAVSPVELMAGKILGQLAVSIVTLALYIGLGLLVLSSMTMIGLIQPILVVYLVIFFAVTYITIGALMAAIGAAVNEMREAQSLMTPITVLIMIPWVLAAPIARNPSSTFATVLSFIPPINTFTMLIRITSTAPPPAWQIALTVVLSIVMAMATLWVAAKIFKVGLLMFGKPPDFATLVRWVRMA